MTFIYTLTMKDDPVIFKLGDWEIHAIDRQTYAFIKMDSIIVHECSSVHYTGDWKPNPLTILEERHLNRRCDHCEQVAPDEIQALWRLQNMENL